MSNENRLWLVALGFVIGLAPHGVSAQAGGAGPASEVRDAGEPELVMPEIVLKIEDLSVESVVSGLPADSELLAPERTPELPALGEPAVSDAAPPVPLAELPSEEEAAGPGLAAEAVVGLGSASHTYGRLAVQRSGPGTRFDVRFLHEMRDGLAGEEPGTGYHQREDSLAASLRSERDRARGQAEGRYLDSERGLQGQGPYYARTIRELAASGRGEIGLAERLALSFGLEGGYTQDLLSGPTAGLESESESETRLLPSAGLHYRAPALEVSLHGRYHFAGALDESSGLRQRHRVTLGASSVFEPSETLRLEGSVGWFWSPDIGHRMPFRIALSAARAPFTLDAAGGYRVEELDWADLLRSQPFTAVSDTLADNPAWFAEARAGVALGAGLSVQARLRWAREEAMPDPGPLPGGMLDPLTGLFALEQQQAERLSVGGGLAWSIVPMVRLSAGLDTEILDRPVLQPRSLLRGEIEASDPAGLWGASASARMALPDREGAGDWLLPIVGASAYWRISRPFVLSLELEDLLAGLLDGPRTLQPPFVEPGTGAILKVQVFL